MSVDAKKSQTLQQLIAKFKNKEQKTANIVDHYESNIFFSGQEKFNLKVQYRKTKINPNQLPTHTYLLLQNPDKPSQYELTYYQSGKIQPINIPKNDALTKTVAKVNSDIQPLKSLVAEIHLNGKEGLLSIEQLISAYKNVAENKAESSNIESSRLKEKAAFRLGVIYNDGLLGQHKDEEQVEKYFKIASETSTNRLATQTKTVFFHTNKRTLPAGSSPSGSMPPPS